MEKITIDKLENKIEKLLEYYTQYPNEDSIESINKIKKDLNNQEYKIAVVANMSSGKSTFINALFGEEVLPAFNHATTDSATFVYSEPNIEKRAVIYFNDGKKSVEIKENLEKEIKQYAQKDEECKDDKYKNVEKIELFYPFKNLQTSSSKDFKITFIDTPGPNSTGDSYKEKHKDQTRSVLNDVDLALFMFDYTQLDANLESDEQGLWKTIQKRHNKDKNFDVYFILNKIDYAFDDNFKDIDTKDKHEFIRLKKENWYVHEKKAIEKLEEAAIKHQIKNPKIYPISSKFELLTRDKNQNWDAQDELDIFQKSHFKRLFENNWEDKCIEYMGILKLEKDIDSYIDSSVKNKILQKIDSQLINIYNEEKKQLVRNKQLLESPKKDAEKNLLKAENFLNNEAENMRKSFNEEIKKLRKEVTNELTTKIDSEIENTMSCKSEELSKRVIYFATRIAKGKTELDAKKDANNLPLNKMGVNLNDSNFSIDIKKEINIDDIKRKMIIFMSNSINEYKNDYLDIQSDIRNIYSKLDEDANNKYDKYKELLEAHLNEKLNIEYTEKKKKMKNISVPQIEVLIPNSSLSYDFNEYDKKETKVRYVERSMWNPKRWFGDKYDKETYTVTKTIEEHKFIINPKNLSESIKKSIDKSIESFYEVEIQNHQNNVGKFGDDYVKLFEIFTQKMKKQIKKLSTDLKDKENQLKIVEKQLLKFEKIMKG